MEDNPECKLANMIFSPATDAPSPALAPLGVPDPLDSVPPMPAYAPAAPGSGAPYGLPPRAPGAGAGSAAPPATAPFAYYGSPGNPPILAGASMGVASLGPSGLGPFGGGADGALAPGLPYGIAPWRPALGCVDPEADEEERKVVLDKRRYERNAREQKRSHKITDQINALRQMLQFSGVQVKGNKYSILSLSLIHI